MKGIIVKTKCLGGMLFCYAVFTGNLGLYCILQTDGFDHAISAWHGCRAIIGQENFGKGGNDDGKLKEKVG